MLVQPPVPDLQALRNAFRGNPTPFTTHAARAMLHHRILSAEVVEVLAGPHAEVIEDYSTDPRGPSCLVHGRTERGRILHVVLSVHGGWVITVYPPAETEPEAWTPDYRQRR